MAVGLLASAPFASAATGTSGSGSIAQTQYGTPAPATSPPLVPVPPAPQAQEVLPAGPQSETPVTPDAPASEEGDTEGESVAPEQEAAPQATERGVGAATPASAALPFTGALALPIAGAGLLLLGTGVVLRRRATV